MRYLDPESTNRSMPRNFDSRGPDIRAKRPAQYADRDRVDRERPSRGDRVERDVRGRNERSDKSGKGEDARRDNLDRDMDRWRHDRSGVQGEKFTRAREEQELLEIRGSRSKSPIGNGEKVLSLAERIRSRSPIPAVGRARSKSPGGSDGSEDMVLEDD